MTALNSTQVSAEMVRLRARARRRMLLSRAFTYLVGILIALWVLVPCGSLPRWR